MTQKDGEEAKGELAPAGIVYNRVGVVRWYLVRVVVSVGWVYNSKGLAFFFLRSISQTQREGGPEK